MWRRGTCDQPSTYNRRASQPSERVRGSIISDILFMIPDVGIQQAGRRPLRQESLRLLRLQSRRHPPLRRRELRPPEVLRAVRPSAAVAGLKVHAPSRPRLAPSSVQMHERAAALPKTDHRCAVLARQGTVRARSTATPDERPVCQPCPPPDPQVMICLLHPGQAPQPITGRMMARLALIPVQLLLPLQPLDCPALLP